MRRWLIALVVVGCHRREVDAQPAPAVVEAAAPSASVSAVAIAPSALPVCKADAGAEPLAVLCDVGKDAAHAHFECKDPEPLMFCGRVDTWSCRTFALGGEKPPPITFEARIDHSGPPIKLGVPMDTKQLLAENPRRGPLRGVAVHYQVKDDDEGKRRLAEIDAKIVSWGCVDQGKHSLGERYSCGTWTIDTHYLDITKIVYVEAGEPNAFECAATQ